MSLKGRESHARSATQGESSKIHPSASTKRSRTITLRSASFIGGRKIIAVNRRTLHANLPHTVRLGQREDRGQYLIQFRAFHTRRKRRVRPRTHIHKIRRFPWRKIADLIVQT